MAEIKIERDERIGFWGFVTFSFMMLMTISLIQSCFQNKGEQKAQRACVKSCMKREKPGNGKTLTLNRAWGIESYCKTSCSGE